MNDFEASLPPLHRLCWRTPHLLEDSHLHAAGNGRCPWGGSPLHWAASSRAAGAADAVERLIAASEMNAYAADDGDALPLHWAVRWGTQASVRLLHAAASARPDRWGRRLVHWFAMGPSAASRGGIFEDLVQWAHRIDERDAAGASAVHWGAAVGGWLDPALDLAPQLANARDGKGGTPLLWLAANGAPRFEALAALVERGADFNLAAADGTLPDSAVPASAIETWRRLTQRRPAPARPTP